MLSAGDLIRAQLWHFSSLWFIRLVYAVNLVAAGGFGLAVARRGFQAGDVRGLAWLGLWFLVLPGMLVKTGWGQYRRLKAKGHTCSWRFSEEDIRTESPQAKATLSWDALERVVETRHALYLFVQPRLFHVVPTRAFRDPGELERLRSLLRAKLGARARLRAS